MLIAGGTLLDPVAILRSKIFFPLVTNDSFGIRITLWLTYTDCNVLSDEFQITVIRFAVDVFL